MAVSKSPFLVYRNFLTPKQCETMVDALGFYDPDIDPDGKPIKMFRYHEASEEVVFNRYQVLISDLMKHYNAEYRGTEQMTFEYLAQGVVDEHHCENSNYVRRKWVRTRDRDITCLIFLCDYNDTPPFDNEFEVYGGKLEFPQHNFGFNPERGTMIVFPSGPHFINANAPILAGDLVQLRFHLATKLPYLYDPRGFPGDYTTWFKDIE